MNFRHVKKKLTFLVASTVAIGSITIPPMNILAETAVMEGAEEELFSIGELGTSTQRTTSQQFNVLNANDFGSDANLATTTSGMYTFTDAKIAIKKSDDTNKMSADGTENFTQAIEFGGTATSSKQSVKFSVSKPATVTFYATTTGGTAEKRQVVLKSVDGDKEIEKTENLLGKGGNGQGNIEKITFNISEAGEYYLGSANSGIYLYKLTVEEEPEKMILNANTINLKENDLKEDTVCGDFTIKATASKNVTIDEITEEAAADGTKFSKAINLKGTGKESERSIHFTTTEKAYVEIYSRSGGDAARTLKLSGPVTKEITAPGKGEMITKSVVEITPGDYYLASAGSGISVYAINVVMGDLPKEEVRAAWSTVTTPQMLSVNYKEGSDSIVEASFSMLTGADGADTVTVEMKDADGNTQASKTVGRSEDLERKVEFTPTESGTYSFVAKAERIGEKEAKQSEPIEFTYKLPLSAPNVNAYNKGSGNVLVKWSAVKEADTYIVEYKAPEGEYVEAATLDSLETVIENLSIDEIYTIRVTAVRGSGENADAKTSEEISIKIKDQVEREWAFTYFGQSSSSSLNTIDVVDQENLTLKLNSCTSKADGSIDKKGGKFTTYHDGISYYYTEVDADEENFEITATFTVDYINPTPDGQEGFGILAMDNLGEYGVASVNHYTNSAGIIATKFEGYLLDEEGNETTKVTLKDGMGSRMVSGITPEVLAQGDTGIASAGKSISTPYSLDTEDIIKQGESYTLTLKKTNTGYHMIYDGKEHIMYNPEKLLQLDNEKVYVGFAAARGCNVTVSDISMKITDPKTDAPAEAEPVQTVKLKTKIDAPTTSAVSEYNFVFNANADGVITVQDSKGNVVINQEAVVANQDYSKILNLTAGNNNFVVTFKPNENYVNNEGLQLNSYDEITINHSVNYKKFAGSTIYVTPNGKAVGQGTVKSPVDIYTAVKYVAPGQIICLADGTYNMTQSLVIPRGMNGTEQERITLKSQNGGRAILDFTHANGGMQIWSDYWHVYGLDICHTPGNVKGLQVAGHNNIIERIDAYSNGDTGIQISGTGTEGFDKWPSNNLILNCTSHDNIDPGENNADGFAAKITCGEGNVFRGCISYNNLDDGWDLFSKIESGPIGAVTLENCITYKNGTLSNGYGDGDGNGFKLGGDGIAVPHILKNSISFGNNAAGITSNSDPAIILENNTSFGNAGANITLYGKGGGLTFVAENNISMDGGSADNYSDMISLVTENNFFYDGTQSINSVGTVLSKDIFTSTDLEIAPTRDADGSINMNGLLELNEKAPAGIGARLQSTKGDIQVPVEKPIQGDSTSNGGSSSNDDSEYTPSTPNNNSGATTNQTADKVIEEALKGNKIPEVSLDKNNAVKLPNTAIESLINSGKELIVKVSDQVNLVIKSQTLKEQKGEALEIKATVPSTQTINKIKSVLKGNQKLTAVSLENMLITLSVNAATEVKSFNEPVEGVLTVDTKQVKDTSKLTAVRYEEQKDGSIKIVKIGGEFDEETGKFNFLTDQVGTFGLVMDENLMKVNLSVGATESVVNGKIVSNDVTPMIVDNRTMLPVRFIAESLGGKVGYKKGEVTITVEDKTIAFKIGVNLENYDVKPFISENRTFISARWVAEELGANVLWVPSSGQVQIVK